MKYKLKTGNLITAEEIELIISKLLFEVIEQNRPHIWVPREEPFINPYTGRVSYDYSGKVQKATFQQMSIVFKGFQISYRENFYLSPLDELLHEIYINRWEPSYESNSGKHWTSYHGLLKDKFDDWKFSSFLLIDENGDYLDEDLDLDIDEVFYRFLKRTPLDLYRKKILNMVKD